jgi:hypothetical protein
MMEPTFSSLTWRSISVLYFNLCLGHPRECARLNQLSYPPNQAPFLTRILHLRLGLHSGCSLHIFFSNILYQFFNSMWSFSHHNNLFDNQYGYQWLSSAFCNFLHYLLVPLSLGPHILHGFLFWSSLLLWSSLWETDKVSLNFCSVEIQTHKEPVKLNISYTTELRFSCIITTVRWEATEQKYVETVFRSDHSFSFRCSDEETFPHL